jgi:hypothetical protein
MEPSDFIVQHVYSETLWLHRTECLQWNALTISYRASTVKRSDYIVQGVYNETLWLYRTECLQWNALTSSYKVSTVKRSDFIVQGVYSKTQWFQKWFKDRQMVFLGVSNLLLTIRIQVSHKFLSYFTGDRWDAPTVLIYKCSEFSN